VKTTRPAESVGELKPDVVSIFKRRIPWCRSIAIDARSVREGQMNRLNGRKINRPARRSG
jgi:hypothetical protein